WRSRGWMTRVSCFGVRRCRPSGGRGVGAMAGGRAAGRQGPTRGSGFRELAEAAAELGLRAQRGAEARGELEQIGLDRVGLAPEGAEGLLDGADLGLEVGLVDPERLAELVELGFDPAQLLVLV